MSQIDFAPEKNWSWRQLYMFGVRDLRRYLKLFAFSSAMLACLIGSKQPFAQVNVYTQHNNNARTGANLQETFLTPENVNVNSFGKLYSVIVDGQIYAQPLYVSHVPIMNQGLRNIVYIATMNNSVYALDADNSGTIYWKANYGVPVASTAVEGSATFIAHGSGVGILGTPVIDPTTDTMYFVSRNEVSGQFFQFLNAIDIRTGARKFGSPTPIALKYTSADGTMPFDPKIQNQRAALTLTNGEVYIAWASHGDQGPYHGWIAEYNALTLALTHTYADTTSGTKGGIWQAGQGLTVDAQGDVLFSSGNGSFGLSAKKVLQTGNSFVKLSSSLQLLDYFTPTNSAQLNAEDEDLGSSGLVSIPGTTLIAGGGKQGVLYLVDTTNMGHFNSSEDKVQQEFQAVYGTGTAHIHGGPVYLDSEVAGPTIYLWGENDYLRAFAFDPSTRLLDPRPFAKSEMKAPVMNANAAMPGGFLSISANGKNDGIVWACTPYNGPAQARTVEGIVHAFDAGKLTELWNDKLDGARDEVGNFAKFAPPTIANGKVFVPTFGPLNSKDGSGELNVYGLLSLLPNGDYEITSVNSGLVLEVPSSSSPVGSALDQAKPNGNSTQLWTVTNLGHNLITLTNKSTAKLAEDNASSKLIGEPIVQAGRTGAANQEWQVNQVGTKTYTLTNKASGFLLEVANSSRTTGAQMVQSVPTGGPNEQWKIVLK